jgi:hypothetical protein
MNPSYKIYDLWGRNLYRILVGTAFAGFGLAFWWDMAHEPDAHSRGWWLVYVIVAMAAVPGLLILLFRRLVFLDSAERQFTRVIYFLGVEVHRRSWLFSDLRRIEAEHGLDDDSYYCYVGFVPSDSPPVWLRTFSNEPQSGPSERAAGFAKELTDATGLPYEIRRRHAGGN